MHKVGYFQTKPPLALPESASSSQAKQGASNFGHWSVKPTSESEVSKYLLSEARIKAGQVKTLRFRLYRGGGMGGESSNFDIFRCWQKLTPGTLEKAEFIYTPKEVPALKALVPGWSPEQTESKILTLPVNGLLCDFIPANCLTRVPIVPFSIVGSSGLEDIGCPLESLRARTCLSLQPLHWISENALICTKLQSTDVLKLEVPKDNHLPVAESDILPSNEACHFIDHYMGSDPGKALMLKTLVLHAEDERISLGIMYGLHRSNRGGINCHNLILEYLKAISYAQICKPAVIYVANDLTSLALAKEAVELHSEFKKIHFIGDFSTQNAQVFVNNISKFPLTLIWGGRIPKAIFEKMVSISHLPVMMEGSNTAELCQSLGKPYLPVGMQSHPFSALPGMSEKNGYLAALLLGYSRTQLDILTKQLELKYENIGEQLWSSLNIYDDRKDAWVQSSFPNLKISLGSNHPNSENNSEWKFTWCECAITLQMEYGDTNVNTSICDLIPAFIANQRISSLKELPTHTRNERFQLIMTLVKSRKLGEFNDYLKQQSEIMVGEFIKQSIDKDSEVSKHCQKLKLHALAPENNTLVKALSQIPAESFAN